MWTKSCCERSILWWSRPGGRCSKKEGGLAEPIRTKADSYVLETNVHFPSDLNLLWDVQRKCADLLLPMVQGARLGGWRKCQDWRRKLKGQMIGLGRLTHGGGPLRRANVN